MNNNKIDKYISRKYLLLLFLTVHTLVMFYFIRDHFFIMDDMKLIGLSIERGWNLVNHFSGVVEITHYAPLATLLFKASYTLYGLNPAYYYITNLIIHLLNSFIVYMLVETLTESTQKGTWSGWIFFILFSHYEITGWISAGYYAGTAFFCVLLSLRQLINHLKNHRIKNLIYAYILFTAGLLFNESALIGLFLWGLMLYFYGEGTLLRKSRVIILPVIVEMIYLLLSLKRFTGGYYVTENVVEYRLTISLLRTGLTYISVMIGSLILPVIWMDFFTGTPGLIVTAILVTIITFRGNRDTRFFLLWALAGAFFYMFFKTDWQSRYTYFAAGGFSAVIGCHIPGPMDQKNVSLKRVIIFLIFLMSAQIFICRLIAHETFYRVKYPLSYPGEKSPEYIIKDFSKNITPRRK